MCNNRRAAKAECGIDEKGVRLRGCGDSTDRHSSDSEADVGMGGSFFGVVSPTCAVTCRAGVDRAWSSGRSGSEFGRMWLQRVGRCADSSFVSGI